MSTSSPLEQTLPHDLEVERLILGWILAAGVLAADLAEEDLYLEAHRIIFRRALDIQLSGRSPDTTTMISELRNTDDLEAAGGVAYVVSLTDGLPRSNASLLNQYVGILKEKAASRKIIAASNEAMVCSYQNQPASDVGANLFAGLSEALAGIDRRHGLRPVEPLVAESYKEVEAIAERRQKGESDGLMLGFKDLDYLIPAGIRPASFNIVAARPSHGKTSLLLGIAANMCKSGHTVAIFSVEMSCLDLMFRQLSAESGVYLSKLTSGFLKKDDWVNIGAAAGPMSGWPMYIDDSPRITVSDMSARVYRLKPQPSVILVDYLQIIGVSKSQSRLNEFERVAVVSMELKSLARRTGIPIIAAAQLNRAPEKRKDKLPELSDLRSSGQIEQDADLVVMLYRPELVEQSDANKGVADALVRKQRNGPTGMAKLAFISELSKFADMYGGGTFDE